MSQDLRPPAVTAVRIGDVERDQAVAALGDHFAAGRLGREELEQRMERALQARYGSDLEPLFADLPSVAGGALQARPPHQLRPIHAWAPALWLMPMLLVGALVVAVVAGAPWVLWALVWWIVLSGLFRHGRRRHGYPAAARRQPPWTQAAPPSAGRESPRAHHGSHRCC